MTGWESLVKRNPSILPEKTISSSSLQLSVPIPTKSQLLLGAHMPLHDKADQGAEPSEH